MDHNFKFYNAKDALNWMVNHPFEHLYDQYGNYYVFAPNANVIEYYHNLGGYEDDNGNIYPDDWDFDRMNVDEFLEFGDFDKDDYLETN